MKDMNNFTREELIEIKEVLQKENEEYPYIRNKITGTLYRPYMGIINKIDNMLGKMVEQPVKKQSKELANIDLSKYKDQVNSLKVNLTYNGCEFEYLKFKGRVVEGVVNMIEQHKYEDTISNTVYISLTNTIPSMIVDTVEILHNGEVIYRDALYKPVYVNILISLGIFNINQTICLEEEL